MIEMLAESTSGQDIIVALGFWIVFSYLMSLGEDEKETTKQEKKTK